jgi:pyrroloquinoline-quinone synthase
MGRHEPAGVVRPRGEPVSPNAFQSELDARIERHKMLTHPFHQAWIAGKLTREQLRAYATEYFHLVAAFPTFLSALHCRLDDGSLRRAVLRNLADEEVEGRAHSDMWLDFAEGLGLSASQVRLSQPGLAVRHLIECFYRSASQDPPVQVLAAIYAYDSQVPRTSVERARALLRHYGADERTCGFFVLHSYADALHAKVWRAELTRLVSRNHALAGPALEAAGRAAEWLWQAMDGCRAHRLGASCLSA